MRNRKTAFDRATLPQDVKDLPHLWKIIPNMGWTDEAVRARVIEYLDGFLEDHDWAEDWEVEESFAMEARGDINVKVRRTTQLLDPGKPFLQRNAKPKLVLRIKQGAKLHELGHLMPEGVATSEDEFQRIFKTSTQYFRAVA